MMNTSSSPPVLYLGDDDDDDNEQNQYFQPNMLFQRASSSIDMNLPRKKRKLTNANVRVNPSVADWPKRQRNDYYPQHSSQNYNDPDLDFEPILLDPDEYIIEEPDPHSYRSFDWTLPLRPSRPPTPPPPPVISTKISSNPIQTISRMPTRATPNVIKRPIDKLVTNSNDRFIQQQRKSIPIPPPPPPRPRPLLEPLPLPLPKPTLSLVRPNVQRGRPVKNSRVPNIQSTLSSSPVRQRPEQQIFPQKQQTSRVPLFAATTVPSSLINNSTSEIRRQVLNGTGIFSAFHDSKYYRCNICKFKSVTSSTLLQHLFTHMFFCDHCSFYTYSSHNLSQHLFDKHHLNLIEDINEPLNPKSFDLLYVTRCPDGTFALCMDSSSSSSPPPTTTNKITDNDQRRIISSATPVDQQQNKLPKKKLVKEKESLNIEDNDVIILKEKCDTNNQSLVHSKPKDKQNQTYVLMKHRRCYSKKKSRCLHSLTLEYNICREHTIRQMSHTKDILKRRKFLTTFHKTRLIDEVANCLRTMVYTIVESEENSDQLPLVHTLPNHILNSILSSDNLNILTNLLKLNNKYDQYKEQTKLNGSEHFLRQSYEHVYILSSSESNQTEQSIISSIHSSMTNGDSIFTQTKAQKLPTIYDNTYRFLKGNSNIEPPSNNSNSKTTEPLPKHIPIRPIISKPSRSLSKSSVDKNNNSVTSSISTKMPSVIILD